tara:strand:- start:134 stop:358 length:225 start_codon:yes stop_codon:yes gene_type:complete
MNTSIQNDYLETLNNINNQIDSMIYELDNFTAESPLKIPVEFKHDSFPIIRRLKEAKKLTEESLYNFQKKKLKT